METDLVSSLLSGVAQSLTKKIGGVNNSEWERCRDDCAYFVNQYCYISDNKSKAWIRFALWAAQSEALTEFPLHKYIIILKARQEGFTWLVIAYFLWQIIFHPISTVLIFSLKESEAIVILDEKMRGMYKRLPHWMKIPQDKRGSNSSKLWRLANGSSVRAFSNESGDGYPATHILIDEASLIEDLETLITRVRPTIDHADSGTMIVLSRANKKKPSSYYNRLYTTAKEGGTDWFSMFISVMRRPDFTEEKYKKECDAEMRKSGSLDAIYEQHPRTDTEALAPRSSNQRLPIDWIIDCFAEMDPILYQDLPKDFPIIPGMRVYQLPVKDAQNPQKNHRYVITADPAEGKENSDDSAAIIMDRDTGEEVLSLAGKIEVATFGDYIDQLGYYYNQADVFPERNNHGHALILWLIDNSTLPILCGIDGSEGWMESSRGKAILYAKGAETLRDNGVMFHTLQVKNQLASIEVSTLKAPKGDPDDLAIAAMLACLALEIEADFNPTVISIASPAASRFGVPRIIPTGRGIEIVLG